MILCSNSLNALALAFIQYVISYACPLLCREMSILSTVCEVTAAREARVCIYHVSTKVHDSDHLLVAEDMCGNRDLAYERTRVQSKRGDIEDVATSRF